MRPPRDGSATTPDDESDDEKLTWLRAATAERPDDGAAWLELADGLDDAGDSPHETLAAYQRAQELLPHVDLRLQLGDAYVEAGDWEQGIATLQAQIADSPTEYGCCYLARAFLRAGETESARKAVERALRIDPDFEEAHYMQAELLRQDEPLAAERAYRRAVELDPEYQLAWQGLGSLLLHDDLMRDEAIAALQTARSLDPTDVWSLIYLGNGLWQNGDRAGARSLFEEAARLAPDEPGVKRALEVFNSSLAESADEGESNNV